jgi:starch synthase
MKAVVSVIGKFHLFDLARELQARQALGCIFTGYPAFKLRNERLPEGKISTYPWINTPYMAFTGRERLGERLLSAWERLNCGAFDAHVARSMPECDVYVGQSSSSLHAGRRARRMGARYVCDRGSSHIRYQDELGHEESRIWGIPQRRVDPLIIEREEAEYAEADCITVPSTFSLKSFVAQGVSPGKLRRLSYGVNLSSFYPQGQADPNRMDILFAGGASLRKGIPYLLQAFKALKHPHKRLYFAGPFSPALVEHMTQAGLWSDGIELLGHLNWDQLRQRMSQCHALVLPSIEDGFGLVLAQALACGCPVIATDHTGAPDLLQNDEAGYIVPIRRSDLLADRLQQLADSPQTQERFRHKAPELVKNLGGWHQYGEEAVHIYRSLLT